MLQWLQQYWGSIVTLAVVALMVGAIIFCHFRARKKGKGSCGGGCSFCSMNGMCHSYTAKQAEDEDKQ